MSLTRRFTRRQALKWGVGLGALAGIGVGGKILLPPRPSEHLAPLSELAIQLFDGLDEDERALVVFDYDHPLRQYHNRGVDTGGGAGLGSGEPGAQAGSALRWSGR